MCRRHSLRCWASAFTARAVSYRARSGLATSLPRMGVVVQRMIRGKTSGVMFTHNPLSGHADGITISACWGSGEGVVSGAVWLRWMRRKRSHRPRLSSQVVR